MSYQQSAIGRQILVWLILNGAVVAQQPLYRQTPYDRVVLDARNGNAVLLVQPLDFPDRLLPSPQPKRGVLTVRLLDQPDPPYEIQWSAIVRVDLFEQMVLGEAMTLVRAGKLDEAYESFVFLQQDYPKVSGFKESYDEYLNQEARQFATRGDYRASLAMLRELYGRDPKRQGLDNALGVVTGKLVEEYVAADNFATARQLLANLAQWYPQHPTIAEWHGRFQEEARKLAAEARSRMEAGQLREADRAGRRMALVWPGLPEARALLESIQRQYPRVVMGVTLPAAVAEPCRLDDWAARRASRLLYRTLTELTGPGTEGGKYVCPLGEMRTEHLGLRLVFELRLDLRWSSGEAVLTGYDLSRQLLAMTDPSDNSFQPEWADILAAVSVAGVYAVEVELSRPHVRPEALLQVPVRPYPSPGAVVKTGLTNGPYWMAEQNEKETAYLVNTQYFASAPTRPKEIVERRFDRGGQAVAALEQGEIEMLDRVNPWDLARLRQDKNLVVGTYAAPLVHCLVPNMRRPMTAHRLFRRALVYGIQREAILKRLLDGNEEPGCQVISGPFSPGIRSEDPLDYAYDKMITPRPYDPRLAVALAQVAFQEVAVQAAERGEKLEVMPEFVLAHPADEVARIATAAIQRQLKLIGVPVRLQELAPGSPPRVPDSADLLYAELAMWEPVFDARRLLGEDGMSGGASAYMGLALRKLEQAADWPEVGRALREIHQLAFVETTVVPLWQLTEHFACHRSLEGVGERPVTLYQNVEQWKPAFRYLGENP